VKVGSISQFEKCEMCMTFSDS